MLILDENYTVIFYIAPMGMPMFGSRYKNIFFTQWGMPASGYFRNKKGQTNDRYSHVLS